MRNIILFFIRNYPFFLFIGLQLLCGILFLNYNSFQRTTFLNSTSVLSGNLYETRQDIVDYLNLKEINAELREELEYLQNHQPAPSETYLEYFQPITDSNYAQKYEFVGAHVIHSTVHKNRNYLTLNKGKNHGVEANMAVKSKDGLIGIVLKSSFNYSLVLPIINNRYNAGVKLKRKNYFGILSWDGKDPAKALVSDVPKHANIEKGDSIVTRSASGIYPTGLFVGTVDSVRAIPGGNYLDIHLELGVDFHAIYDVTIVKNLTKSEQASLEKTEN